MYIAIYCILEGIHTAQTEEWRETTCVHGSMHVLYEAGTNILKQLKRACTDRASACRDSETEIEERRMRKKRRSEESRKRAACASLFSMKITDKEEIQITKHEV